VFGPPLEAVGSVGAAGVRRRAGGRSVQRRVGG
jgi:hypothetical protein